jgi:Prophage minor tail protein Z (GPZ)
VAKIQSSIGKVARSINGAVKSGSLKAVNKAITATRNKIYKDLRIDTGLSKASLDKRVLTLKANAKKLNASVNIAVKFGVQIAEFKPKEKAVKRDGIKVEGRKGRPKKRTYYGVTAKIGNQPRQLVPGGFLRTVKNGKELVLARKATISSDGSYTPAKTAPYPTVSLKTDILQVSAEARQQENMSYLRNVYDDNVKIEIEKQLEIRLNKT